MALNPNALVSVAEAKAYLKVEHIYENSLIESLINSASDQIEYEKGTCIKAADITSETHGGEGDSFVVLRNYPINSITSVLINDESMALTNFTYVSSTGILTYAGLFPKGSVIKISYNAGYSVVPNRYKMWCLQLVSDYYEGRGGEL